MLAMTYRGPYRVRVIDKPIPEIEHPRDAIVRVTRACICGSDLHLYHGLMPDTRVGQTFGHEFVGVVEEVGSARADRSSPATACSCRSTSSAASATSAGSRCSATATTSIRMRPRSAESTATRTPPAATTAARPSTCAFRSPTSGPMKIPDTHRRRQRGALHRRVPDRLPGRRDGARSSAAIRWSSSAPGRSACSPREVAWFMGAGRVLVVDEYDYRLEFARRFAQCETLNFRDVRDPVWYLKKESDWLGWDAAIDAVGCEARGSAMQRAIGIRPFKLQAGAANGAQLGHRLGAQGRRRLDHRRLRARRSTLVADRRRHEQGADAAHEPGQRQAQPAALHRAHRGRPHQPQGRDHAPLPARGDQRGLPHLLEQARRMHQADGDSADVH